MSQYISGQLESVATAGSPDSVFSPKKNVSIFLPQVRNVKKKITEIKVMAERNRIYFFPVIFRQEKMHVFLNKGEKSSRFSKCGSLKLQHAAVPCSSSSEDKGGSREP